MKKIIASILTLTAIASLAACGEKKEETAVKSDMPTGEIQYPVETEETVRYWVRLPSSLGSTVTNFSETEFAKEYMKRTGVKIEYLHPAAGEEAQSLNLLIASNDLPDIIETNWLSNNPSSMIRKKVILALNDYMDYAPNLKKYLSENPDVDKQIKTDESEYYVFPFIRNGEKLLATSGFMARADWMSELGLESPETIEEWELFLEAMKTKCDYPLAIGMATTSHFLSGFGIDDTYYVDSDGKVAHGAIKPEYKEFLITMNRWYEKGLIDKNAAVINGQQVQSNMLNGKAAVDMGAGGSGMGMYLNAKKGEAFDLIALPYPSTEKGVKAEFGNKQFKYSPVNGAAITAQAKNPALCARLLDYSYSEEGSMFNNFGIEGVSYEMKDGFPTYSDVITNNPEGLAMSQSLPIYVRAANEGPFVQDERYIVQYYQNPQQQAALDIWGNNNHDKHLMPQITLTDEESNEFAKIDNAIKTYTSEMLIKFITGEEPIDNFDKFVEQLKSMNIEKAIEIQQAALDRFNKR